jgi:hypothetical protein
MLPVKTSPDSIEARNNVRAFFSTKNPGWPEFFECFRNYRLVLFGHRLDAAGADILFHTVDFLGLQVYAELSESLDVGMADLVSRLRAASADGTYFAHIGEMIVA